MRDVIESGFEWDSAREAAIDELEASFAQQDVSQSTNESPQEGSKNKEEEPTVEKTWWERLVEQQEERDTMAAKKKGQARLQPLQNITAVEPSQGMMEVAMMVLSDEVPKVYWRKSLPEPNTGESDPKDLVIAAYTFSEIATPEARKETLLRLWEQTAHVLVIIEAANIPNFGIMMELRTAMLEMKGVGLWDNQPTIVGPCPHEERCPIQHCAVGVRKKQRRVCHGTVGYRMAFVEKWVHKLNKNPKGLENFSYLVIARNETVPYRAERRREQIVADEKARAEVRHQRQEELKKAEGKDAAVPERVSEEVEVDEKQGVPSQGMKNPGEEEVVPWVKADALTWQRRPTPLALPVPHHKYNRVPGLDVSYAKQRLVSSNEVWTVRAELDGYRERLFPRLHKYYRIVSEPMRRGHIWADFCTPEGELMKGKVYRRYYPAKGTNVDTATKKRGGGKNHSKDRWEIIGGWQLLKHSMRGGLFPHDVPISSGRKYHMLDYPNTFVDVKRDNAVENTAMALNTPRTTVQQDPPDSEEAAKRKEQEELRKAVSGRTHNARDFAGHAKEFATSLVGEEFFSEKVGTPLAWEDRKISTTEWKRVVQASQTQVKRRMKDRRLQIRKTLKDNKKPSYVP